MPGFNFGDYLAPRESCKLRFMASTDPAQAMFLGITIKDAVTAILIPIVAVFATLVFQQRQQQNDRRMNILRTLLATRHLAADPGWTASINLIPVEFNKVKPVMTAWADYIKEVRFRPPEDQRETHLKQVVKVQTKLITSIMKKLRLTYSEADIQADAYASNGFIDRDNLWLDSLKAQPQTAAAMTEIARILTIQAQMLGYALDNRPAEVPSNGAGRIEG